MGYNFGSYNNRDRKMQNSIQQLWREFKAANPTNNMIERKIQREAFYAGAEALRGEQSLEAERDYLEFMRENFPHNVHEITRGRGDE
jgi:hypothetical protein